MGKACSTDKRGEKRPENVKGRDRLGDLGVDGSVILKLVLEKKDVIMWTGSFWLWMWTNGASREHTNGPFLSEKVGQFHERFSDYQLF
jgi:hypothetical protein